MVQSEPMFRLQTTVSIESSHIIPNHPGKCRNLHGHSWNITVSLEAADVKPETGMVIDFGIVKDVIRAYDHQHLNDHLPLPTAENLAAFLWSKIRARIVEDLGPEAAKGLCELLVRVQETAGSFAEYRALCG